MSEKPLLSLIIAVYNKAEHLKMVLAACDRQTLEGFEVIVADDGSDASIKDTVELFQKKYPFSIKHVWHEDKGWRKNAILNKGIRNAEGNYLVFIDGDCVPHTRFLEDHWSEREEKRVLCGRRVLMSERWSRQLRLELIESGSYEGLGLLTLWDGMTRKASNLQEGIRLKSQLLRKILHPKVRGIMGCNFSLYKKDIEAINGFDELYDGPGFGEDTDIQFRLELIGLSCKSLRHKAVLFHTYHPKTKVSQACIGRFEGVKLKRDYWCQSGLLKNKSNLILLESESLTVPDGDSVGKLIRSDLPRVRRIA